MAGGREFGRAGAPWGGAVAAAPAPVGQPVAVVVVELELELLTYFLVLLLAYYSSSRRPDGVHRHA